MGACSSASVSPGTGTKSIDRFLKDQQAKEEQMIKILFLGTGNSGKSTFMKQFKMLTGNESDPMLDRPTLSHNITKSVQVLANACLQHELLQSNGITAPTSTRKLFTVALDILAANRALELWDELKTFPTEIQYALRGELPPTDGSIASIGDEKASRLSIGGSLHAGVIRTLDPEDLDTVKSWKTVSDVVACLWEEPILKQVVAQYNKFDVEVPVTYFMNSFDRIRKSDFIPSTNDVLRIRQRTTGVNATIVEVDGIEMRLIDVGGQRNERKKWISQFDNVTIILFLVSVGDYDLHMMEDKSKLRIIDAIEVFRYIVECPYFHKTDMLLFLNKTDLFREKIDEFPLFRFLPDYKGSGGYESSINYLKVRFAKEFKKAARARLDGQELKECSQSLTIHETVATDPANAKRVFAAVKETVQKANLRGANILS